MSSPVPGLLDSLVTTADVEFAVRERLTCNPGLDMAIAAVGLAVDAMHKAKTSDPALAAKITAACLTIDALESEILMARHDAAMRAPDALVKRCLQITKRDGWRAETVVHATVPYFSMSVGAEVYPAESIEVCR